MRSAGRFTKRSAAALLCAGMLTTASCALGPKQLPIVGSQAPSGGYTIELHFQNAMNLPAGAYVMLDGLQVGKVEKIQVTGSDLTVTAGLSQGTRVPSDVHATIRQDTLLGDTYVGLDRGPDTGNENFLPPGGSILESQTSSPPQLEDTMAVLAYFVNGGNIQKVEDTMSRINSVMPAVKDIRQLSTVMTEDIHDLGHNTASIDNMLSGFDRTARSVADRSDILNLVMFNDKAQYYWRQSDRVMIGHIGPGLPLVGSLFFNGSWLVPMLDSLAGAVHAGRGTWDAAPTAADKVSAFLRDAVLPFVRNPSVNITSVESPKGDQMVGDMENVLRMLGAMQ
ncbi:MAG: MCE family protein [Nocardia sp.]|nr:MCE family protein [Nocardia sp.]